MTEQILVGDGKGGLRLVPVPHMPHTVDEHGGIAATGGTGCESEETT